MKRIVFWFDVISPFVHLAFARLPEALVGCSYEVVYRPVLFASLLQHHGQKGPAEIDSKRAWTFRHVHWLAHEHGVPMDTPLQHPFNPLPLLRLGLACAEPGGLPNRRVVEALLAHVWHGGADASDAARLATLTATLAPPRDPASAEVKAELRAHSEEALRRGLFGVPSFELDGRVFWGLDSLPMLRAALRDEAWFDGPAWQREGAPRAGVQRGG
jgi:2-hydroxychromene-2-carboxylate isomerase